MKQPIVAVEELKDSIGHLVKRLRVDRRIMGATDSCSPDAELFRRAVRRR